MYDFLFNVQLESDIVYDIETYPNVFTGTFMELHGEQEWYFEISPWRDDLALLLLFMLRLRQAGCRGVGFNNQGFDYPVCHYINNSAGDFFTVETIYGKAMSIINGSFHNRFDHMVWDDQQLFPQVDLLKVHHFDNPSKATSLKVLEFNMRSKNVADLPFPVGSILTKEQVAVLRRYNRWDVTETKKFALLSAGALEMREQLSKKFGQNMMNCSDVKIGEKILLHTLEQRGIATTVVVDGKKKKLQTQRDQIIVKDIIFPYVRFDNPEFNMILSRFRDKVIVETKGVFEDMVAVVDGVEYKFGTGGLHASVESQVVASSDTHQLVDVDVASFYPNLGIKNKLFPAHLGVEFCDAYEEVYLTRKTYKKGTAENEAYKLALNGAYGNSNNDYSALKDSQYTMTITINGQLLLCMLVDQLIKVPGLRMIQANTDGVTYLCPRPYLEHTRELAKWWMGLTKLELEEALYSRMFIRDVNSYIAEKLDGKLKRIGAYAYETALENPGTRELPWHKDWSFRVVAMAAEAALVRGADIREFIESHVDVYDFFGRTKVPRSSELHWGGEKVENIVRYYISTDGKALEKVMPAAGPSGTYKRANGVPEHFYRSVLSEIGEGVWDERIHTKNQSRYEERRIGVNTGWRVTLCNRMDGDEAARNGMELIDVFDNINYEFYIKEAQKLVTLLKED